MLLTTRSTCRGEIFEVRRLGQSPRKKYPNFWRYPYFLITQSGIGGKKSTCQETSSIRPVVSIQYRVVSDGRTEGQTDSIYRASMASRGRNEKKLQKLLVGDSKGETHASRYLLGWLSAAARCGGGACRDGGCITRPEMVCVRRTGWRRLASDDVGEKRSTGGAERADDERSPAPGSGRCVSDGTLSDAPLRSSLHWHGSSRIRVSKYDVRPSVDIDSVSCLRQPDNYTAAETYAGRVGAPPIIRNRINARKKQTS